MRETPRLPGTTVDGDPNVDDIPDALEQVIQVAVSHFERHVANEESLGRWIERFRFKASTTAWGQRLTLVCSILHSKATTLEELLIESLDCFCGLFSSFKINVTKSVIADLRLAGELFSW